VEAKAEDWSSNSLKVIDWSARSSFKTFEKAIFDGELIAKFYKLSIIVIGLVYLCLRYTKIINFLIEVILCASNSFKTIIY
jgi:hypothetical protein